jgi:hypothetical protein
MRFLKFMPAVVALFVAGAAHAQAWDAYVNRDDFFSLNLPTDPEEKDVPYETAKGTKLTAHVYTAEAPADSILAGTYSLTVVDYGNAKDELKTAMDEATAAMRKKGKVTYEGVNMLDNHRSWRMSIDTPNQRRILVEILAAMNNRLYISQADTPLTSASPAQFQASLQILDENGVRIRYRQVQPLSADEVVPVTPQQRAKDTADTLAEVKGTFKVAGGSCDATAFYKSGVQTKTKRGENSMEGTITRDGMVVKGQLILAGPRVGQFINFDTDMVIFIFDPKPGNKIIWTAMGAPVLGWPDTNVELCPGTNQG